MGRWVVRAGVAIVLVLAIALASIYAFLRRSLPVIDGETTVQGISAAVDIVRDADAVPHVLASNKADALFGLGYVHAQDRLWQMEFQRRIGYGRLSEIFGAATIPQDRFLRTVGFARAARSAWAATPAWAREQVSAYVAGINAFIATHHGSRLPPEFSLLRFEPEPWSGPDVIVWVKMMAWDLSANYSFELLRHDLIRAVGVERMAQLMPPYAIDGLSILPKGNTTEGTDTNGGHGLVQEGSVSSVARDPTAMSSVLAHWSATLTQGSPAVGDFLMGAARSEGLGSNNWVVDGTLTASGKPLLANDPHLGTRLPSTWYLAHVKGGDFEIIGATLPGAPAVALGRNRFIAWGATNVAADVEDLYRERLDPTGTQAEFRGAMEPLAIIPETIAVKGRPPLEITVRVTRHGPIVSDAINANPPVRGIKPAPLEPLAFRWTALDAVDTTLQSFLRLNEARNWTEFTGAIREYVVPSQNFVYADVDGHIGYYAPGHIPIRGDLSRRSAEGANADLSRRSAEGAKADGSSPADGWTGAAEWTGWIPFEDLPHLYDPPDHMIVTANHRPTPGSYRYHLGMEWPEPYRAERIWELLRSGGPGGASGSGASGASSGPSGAGSGPHSTDLTRAAAKFTPDDFARFQADTLSLHAKTLLPVLLAHAQPEAAADRRAVEILRGWNFDASGSSVAATLFEAWFHQLAPALVGDELPRLTLESYMTRYTFITRFVLATLSNKDSRSCDDITTDRRETCEDAVTAALHTAVGDLAKRLGSDETRWRWDSVHHAVFPHQGLDSVRALRPLLSRSVPSGGDWSTVNVGPFAADAPFEQRSVPGYREIIDLSPANDSRFLDAIGQSGHLLSPHYSDFLPDWRSVKHRKMRMERADIERGAIGRLRLKPQ